MFTKWWMDNQNAVQSQNEVLLGWCKRNSSFHSWNSSFDWNTFQNKCGYVIHHFNEHFSLYVFLLTTYDLLFIFI